MRSAFPWTNGHGCRLTGDVSTANVWVLPDLNTVVRRIVALQISACTLGVYEFASRR